MTRVRRREPPLVAALWLVRPSAGADSDRTAARYNQIGGNR